MASLPPKTEATLIRQAQLGDQNAKSVLVSGLGKLTASMARKLARAYKGLVPAEELEQEGVVGLIEAIDKFDLTRRLRLSTFSAYWMRRRMLELIERTLKHPSRSMDTLRNSDDNQAPREEPDENGNSPVTLHDLIASQKDGPEEEALREERMKVLQAHVDHLPENYRWLIEAVFGLGRDPITLAQASKELGIVPQRASVLLSQALSSLKESMTWMAE